MSKKYFNGKFPIVDGQELNSWLGTQEAKAAASAFLGTDYNTTLRGVSLKRGKLRQLVTSWLSLPTTEERREFIMQQEQAGRFKERGATVSKCLGSTQVFGHSSVWAQIHKF